MSHKSQEFLSESYYFYFNPKTGVAYTDIHSGFDTLYMTEITLERIMAFAFLDCHLS
jgi:hypothetical protein